MIRRGVVLSLFFLLLLSSLPLEGQQAYRISGNQLVVDRRAQWEAWKTAGGLVDISAQGVRPKFIRKNINAALDAEQFSASGQGGVQAGSNLGTARNLIDGDMGTFWAPDLDRPPEEWWVRVNLGRTVVISKIVLRFAAEGEGDPFLQFKVLVWRNGPVRTRTAINYTLLGTDTPNFWEIGSTDRPNKDQRAFEFVPPTTEPANPLFEGDPLEQVQVLVTDSDFDRAVQIAQQDYEALPDERRGVVEYYRRSPSGRQVLISREVYEALDAGQQGEIKYFRREEPRLAEIEVWTAGDNINFGTPERGGLVESETHSGLQQLGSIVTDGNYRSGHDVLVYPNTLYNFFEDLGALFWIDTMHFLMDGATPLRNVFVDVSDGTRAPDGSIKWTRVATSIENVRYRELRIDPVKVRFLRIPHGFTANQDWTTRIAITDVMLYGEGYVPEAALSSGLINLGNRKNLIALHWEADEVEGSRVQLQTRTGNTLDEENIYHDNKGNIVTEARYNRLPKQKQGEITSTFKAGGDWSPWSPPHRRSGEAIQSPSPREFMEIRAAILSDSPESSTTLNSIQVELSDPVADRLVGEVFPNRVQATGQAEEFSFFLRPSFSRSTQDFDEIRIAATAGAVLSLADTAVHLGRDADFAPENQSFDVFRPADLVLLSQAPDTLWFRLPEAIRRGVDLVEVRFSSTFFANSASFSGAVQASDAPGFWQRVDGGEATDLVNSQTTTVVALGQNQILGDVRLDSGMMTPNNDGVNDRTTFNFSVGRLSADKAVRVTIHDLSGAEIRELVERRADPRGDYVIPWSGEDDSGQLVPPGIYLARIQVEVDADAAAQASVERLVHVAY